MGYVFIFISFYAYFDFFFDFFCDLLVIQKCVVQPPYVENTTTQNLWDTIKAVLRGKFIAIPAYLKKKEKSQTNNLTLYLKQLEKEEMKNPRVSRRKEILKIRAEINAKETRDYSKNQQSQKLVL